MAYQIIVRWRLRSLRLVVLGALLAAGACEARKRTAPVLEIGTARQLLLDDGVVASTRNLKRRLHRLQRHPANPVIVGDTPWERWTTYPNGRPVLFDPESGEFKIWYMSSLVDDAAHRGIRYKVGYAVSKDGVHWTKPELGLVEWQGSRSNNIIPWGTRWMRRANVIRDPRDPDPDRRFKMTYVDVFDGKSAITKGHSADGVHWKLNADGKPWFRRAHSANLLGWDPRIESFVCYVRMPGSPNSVGRSTSPDFVTWSDPEPVLVPGPDESNLHFKGLSAFLYEGRYLGWLWVFERGDEGWVRADAELAYSRDGVRWQRIFPGEFILGRGEAGAWDSHLSIPVAPVVHQDRIRVYYWGENFPYGSDLRKVQAGWVEQGERKQRATGLATLRRDGFVSFEAGEQTGRLTTRNLRMSGNRLILNADVGGDLRVEILDTAGRPLSGFTSEACDPVSGDSLGHRVSWNGNTGLGGLRNRALRLRFQLRDGNLYAFQFID